MDHWAKRWLRRTQLTELSARHGQARRMAHAGRTPASAHCTLPSPETRVFLLSECLLVLLPRLQRVSKGQNQKQDLYERHGTVAVPFVRARNVSITQKQPPSLLCPAQATGVWRASLSSHLMPWNPHLERRWLAGMGAPVQRAPASPWHEQGTCITLVSANSKKDYWPSIALLDLPAATKKPSQFPWEDFLSLAFIVSSRYAAVGGFSKDFIPAL